MPSDAWLQLLVYRKDRLARAHLPSWDSYHTLVHAPAALTGNGRYGMSAATDPADVFTQQSFEDLALAHGCRLVDDHGTVALGSAACRTAFGTYDQLGRRYGAPGTQTVDSTRATYFAGALLDDPVVVVPARRAGGAALRRAARAALSARRTRASSPPTAV